MVIKGAIKYVQIQPDVDLYDMDFQELSTHLRGFYWSLKFYLYCNNGKCPLKYAKLTQITGSKTARKDFAQVKKFFIIKGRNIEHKTVSADLRKAKKFFQDKRKAGLKSAKARSAALQQCSNSDAAKESKRNVNESKEKESKDDTKPHADSEKDLSISNSAPFRSEEQKLVLLTCELFDAITNSDKTTLRNIAAFVRKLAADRDDKKVFSAAYKLAQNAKKQGRKPIALYVDLMKKELGYTTNSS
ncbi:MAG: hypothetical protein KAJ07_05675 [Planctomycetes bacterium]|nr:hypothetical protein [Planctomycetota bacterium]